MEALGQLTGGIAHDFNNILTVITGTIEILADAVRKEPQLAAITRMIDEAASRGADLTQHLLAFARKQPLQPREVDVNTLLIDTAKLLRPTLGEHIEIETMLEDEDCFATVDPNQLTTAILNLALNARDAMSNGGKLVLETGSVYLDEGYASAHGDVEPGRYIRIAVSDTGSGIPAVMLDKVFDPFFTSKGPGKGTGLGLSMVYGFVKQSAGHIKIYSEEGHGTTIKMYLPPGTATSAAARTASTASLEGGDETILVVEDDRLVRDYVLTQLRSLGYVTLEAAHAAEAIAIVKAGQAFDLLFTDVIMPGGLNGRQLADELQKIKPGLKVLFTSGYTDNAIVHGDRLDAGTNLLSKPYTSEALARKIRHVLADRQQKTLAANRSVTKAAEPPRAANDRAGSPLRVLLVEDEELVRMTTVEMLTDLGYEVVEAGSSIEAKQLITTEQIDILLTDVGLPGLSGTELAAEARRRSPSLPIIFLTGHRHVPGIEAHPELATATLLSKPYGQDALARALEKARIG
jgi:CheY-like chemotaxis protein